MGSTTAIPVLTRIPSLDGIRAIAILLVLICHMGNDLGWEDPLLLGSLGVRIFFVLSGFLITTLLVNEEAKSGEVSLARFYFRRTLRIFPPFYFYLAVLLVLSAMGYSTLTLRGALPALTYTSNYWDNWEQAGYVTSHTWSLSTEEQFYLIWPFLFVFAGRYRGVALGLACALLPLVRLSVYLAAGKPVSDLSAFHLTADHIGMGCLLALWRTRLHGLGIYRQLLRPAWMPGYAALVLFMNVQSNHPSLHLTVLPSAINLLIALGIDGCISFSGSGFGRLLNSAAVSRLGVLSYSIYLWQQPFLHLHGVKPALLLSGPFAIIRHPVVALGMTMLCATVSYYLIERPSLRLRERFERRIFEGVKRVIPNGRMVQGD